MTTRFTLKRALKSSVWLSSNITKFGKLLLLSSYSYSSIHQKLGKSGISFLAFMSYMICLHTTTWQPEESNSCISDCNYSHKRDQTYTDYAMRWAIRVANPGRGNTLLFSPKCPLWLWDAPSPLFKKHGRSFPEAKTAGAWISPLSSI
jgi:hypothetical protein